MTVDLSRASLTNASTSRDGCLEQQREVKQFDDVATSVTNPPEAINMEERNSCDVANHMTDQPEMVAGDSEGEQLCCVCKDGDGELLSCDLCPLTYHLGCLTPPIGHTPGSDWKCPKCAESADKEDSARLLTREELIEQLLSVSPIAKGEVTTVGMVGMSRML